MADERAMPYVAWWADGTVEAYQTYGGAEGATRHCVGAQVLRCVSLGASQEGDGQPEGWRERLADLDEFLRPTADAAPATLAAAVNWIYGRPDRTAADRAEALAADTCAALAAAGPGGGLDREALAADVRFVLGCRRAGFGQGESYCTQHAGDGWPCTTAGQLIDMVAAALAPLLTGGGE